jgi:hypothetical protein
VSYGAVVDTGGTPVAGRPPEKVLTARTPFARDISLDYEAVARVEGFDGPMFSMDPEPSGHVTVRFIPWHREWSHSIAFGILFGLLGWLALGRLYGFIITLAFLAHILLDQMGVMGSNLFYPFRRARKPGYKLAHSGAVLPNLAAVWLSCLVIFWNLYMQADVSVGGLNFLSLVLWGAVMPYAAFLLLRRLSSATAQEDQTS